MSRALRVLVPAADLRSGQVVTLTDVDGRALPGGQSVPIRGEPARRRSTATPLMGGAADRRAPVALRVPVTRSGAAKIAVRVTDLVTGASNETTVEWYVSVPPRPVRGFAPIAGEPRRFRLSGSPDLE